MLLMSIFKAALSASQAFLRMVEVAVEFALCSEEHDFKWKGSRMGRSELLFLVSGIELWPLRLQGRKQNH